MDDCSIGRNGCHTSQEIQKTMVKLQSTITDTVKDVYENKKSIKDINKILFKQASIICGITVAVQLLFKFWG